MIQRIQTLYLLAVVGLLITGMCLPLGYLVVSAETTYRFTTLSISSADHSAASYGLFCILLFGAIIALGTVFLYKNRKLQIRLSILNSLLLVGFYLACMAYYNVLNANSDGDFRIHWALFLPLACIVLNMLAIRAIRKDEMLVKATDRLR